MNQLKSIYNSLFKDSHSHPIHTCFLIIVSNDYENFDLVNLATSEMVVSVNEFLIHLSISIKILKIKVMKFYQQKLHECPSFSNSAMETKPDSRTTTWFFRTASRYPLEPGLLAGDTVWGSRSGS